MLSLILAAFIGQTDWRQLNGSPGSMAMGQMYDDGIWRYDPDTVRPYEGPGTRVYVSSNGQHVPESEADAPLNVAPILQDAVVATGDPYGLMSLLNSYRASMGLATVAYDANLTYWADQNNQDQAIHGIGHRVMGTARRQNAAGNMSFPSVFYAWMGSPGHASALFDPSVTLFGVAYSYGWWTFDAR